MTVAIDPDRREVILTGAHGAYEARLSWAAALNLGSQLQHAAQQIEPPAPAGKRYCPKIGRWG